jgi:hypothetical protein
VTSRATVVFFGALRVMVDGVERVVRRGMLIEFGDTQALQEAANSGFSEFDGEPGDDTVAVILEKPRP